MKRHLAPLLQRQRTEFDQAHTPRRAPSPAPMPDAQAALEVRDGYDWLSAIRSGRAIRAAAARR